MNLTAPGLRLAPTTTPAFDEETRRTRQLRSMLTLALLYITALVAVIVLPESADIGCILGGLAGHTLYAFASLSLKWRDDASLAYARGRLRHRLA